MVELNSLQLQLENLKVLKEDAMLKGFSLSTIKMLPHKSKK
jgi:hypothetical protein